jgi:hypothetical protein
MMTILRSSSFAVAAVISARGDAVSRYRNTESSSSDAGVKEPGLGRTVGSSAQAGVLRMEA